MNETAIPAELEQRFASLPIVHTLPMRVLSVGQGRVSMRATYEPRMAGIFQSFHGGLLMTLADTAACVAVLTLAGADAIVTTTDMNIRFLAPCLTDAIAHASVIKFGKTLCPVEVDLTDLNGTRVAVAQVTYMRLERRSRR